MQIIQEVDKYYQDNPGKLDTLVIEVVLGQLTKASPAEAPARDDEEMRQAAVVIMVAAFLVGGCSGMSTTQQRTLSGAPSARSGASSAGRQCPACWEGMLTTSTRNPRAGHEGICLMLRVTSW